MKYGLSEDQLQELIDFLKQYPEVEEAVLFGSRAIDTYKEASDVDIALKGEKVTASLAAQLKFDIEEDSYLPFFFDFVAYPTITNEALREHIEKKGVVIYWKAWREYRLGDLYDFASGLSKSRDQFGFGYGFLAFKDVFNNYFVPEELSELANTTEKERSRCSINRGDVFLTRTSETIEELGMSCVALKDYLDASFNGFTKRLRPKEQNKILPEFAGFYFRSPRFRAEVTSMASITTRASLNNGMLRDLSITIPPLPEQKAIASVLSSLDDKIDLLHRQNKTLEAMAETLYRHWFVEEAEDDWEEGCISDLCLTITKGTTPTTLGHQFTETGVNFVKAESITDNGYFIWEKFAKVSFETHAFLNRSKLQEGDVLCSIAGTIGRVAIASEDILPANTNQAIAIIRINPAKCFPEFLYLFMKSSIFREIMDGKIVHAVQPNLSLGEIGSTPIKIPPSSYLLAFKGIIQSIFRKKKENYNHIRTLEKLRDTLLPKLMGGEVRVEYENRDAIENGKAQKSNRAIRQVVGSGYLCGPD